jgi:hypothetical protein
MSEKASSQARLQAHKNTADMETLNEAPQEQLMSEYG